MAIHIPKQELLYGAVLLDHCGREGNDRLMQRTNVSGGARGRRAQPGPRLLQHIVDHGVDQAPDRLVAQPMTLESRIFPPHPVDRLGHMRYLGKLIDGEDPGPKAVVHVMVVIGDIVRDRRHLSLGTRETLQFQILNGVVVGDRLGQGRAAGMWPQKRAVMLYQAFQRFPGQV